METRLLDLRESSGLKQKDLAQILNIPARTYGNYESGTRVVPLEILVELAGYYQTSTDYILKITDEKKAYPKRKKLVKA